MTLSSNGSSECPDGYRRYVYRINIKLPLAEQPRPKPPPPRELETEDEIISRLAELEQIIVDSDKERKRLRRRLAALRRR
jgi:hypothetical protein